MKTLYVTDLDGTLLNSQSRISSFSLETINGLVERGMDFTYATARSLTSASVVTEGLTTRLPIIAYNGTMILDTATGKILASTSFTPEETSHVIQVIETYHLSPLVYSLIGQEEKVSWVTQQENQGMRHYLSLRKGDKRLRPLAEGESLYLGEVFYFTCIGTQEELLDAYAIISKDARFRCTLQQEINRLEYWLEVMPKHASKAHGIKMLKELGHWDKVVWFGDAINDIPLFRLSEEAYAVANAVEPLKDVATGVIGSNDEDGVARFLLKREEPLLHL